MDRYLGLAGGGQHADYARRHRPTCREKGRACAHVLTGSPDVSAEIPVGEDRHPTWLDLAHRKLDEAELDAYGWPHDISDEEILERLLALNLERAQ